MKEQLSLPRLQESIDIRQKLLRQSNAIRWINSVGDEQEGWTLDQYNKHFQIQIFSVGALALQDEICSWVLTHFEVEFLCIKIRVSPSGGSLQDPKMEQIIGDDSQTIVTEMGLKFSVDLLDTINPGLFLDMRANREKVTQNLQGKSLLNCFCYTGSFGVHAARSGATTTNVDISAKILAKAKKNYELNALEGEFVRADVREYFALAKKQKAKFDVIVIDPPSFSRTGAKDWSLRDEIYDLVSAAIPILAKDGSLFVSTNYSGFDGPKLKSLVSASMKKSKILWKSCKIVSAGVDFPSVENQKESTLYGVWVKFPS